MKVHPSTNKSTDQETMKASISFLTAAACIYGSNAFVPNSRPTFVKNGINKGISMAKYNNMDEILAKFPEDKPILINFYDAATENDIKSDIVRAKNLLKDRCTVVSIKQQDYPGEKRVQISSPKRRDDKIFIDVIHLVCTNFNFIHFSTP